MIGSERGGMQRPRILVIADDRSARRSIQRCLAQAGYPVEGAAGAAEGLPQLTQRNLDLVVLEARVPGRSLELLARMRQLNREVPIIVVAEPASIEGAVEAIQEGADDYLPRASVQEELPRKIEKALEAARRRKYGTEQAGYSPPGKVIAESPKMKQALELAHRVAESRDSTGLIQGETGTGKDLLARLIHFESPRRDRPFQVINCAAIPDPLLESELFGYEKGAFTDATTAKPGLFELAQGGTVFLNEIGDLSLSLQAKLLQVLEEKRFRRLGGTQDVALDVRILAATNRDLTAAMERNQFRKDLYFRLQVFPIHLAPLRERREDIMPLAYHFLEQLNREFPKKIRGFTESFEACALYAAWPGNARELRNVVERGVILCRDGDLIPPDLLPPLVREPAEDLNWESAIRLPPEGIPLAVVEKELIRQALQRTGGHQGKAAKLLHIGHDALRYRLGKYGYL
jgi:two-component system response regulator AtoC